MRKHKNSNILYGVLVYKKIRQNKTERQEDTREQQAQVEPPTGVTLLLLCSYTSKRTRTKYSFGVAMRPTKLH